MTGGGGGKQSRRRRQPPAVAASRAGNADNRRRQQRSEDLLCISTRSNYRYLINQFNANSNNHEETGRMSITNDNNISIKEFGEYP